MDKFSYLGNGDVNAVEELFIQFKKDPASVDKSWQDFFKGFEFAKTDYSEGSASNGSPTENAAVREKVSKEFAVINLINAYRTRGHLFTKTNPVRQRRKYKPDMSYDVFDLKDSDLDTVFQAGTEIEIGPAKLRDIIAHLEKTYCDSIGVEY